MAYLFEVDETDAGKRLDQYLKHRLDQFSRSQIQDWIRNEQVLVNGVAAKASQLLKRGEQIEARPVTRPPLKAEAEDLPLDVLYEDPSVIAINKAAGMVVHAGAGVHSGTLVNALLHRFQRLSTAGGELRPGIVHRLDRFTSGVLLVARNDAAHQHLAAQFADRQVEKTYLALVNGLIKEDCGKITKPVARDPVNRVKMTVRTRSGRAAYSEYRVLERFSRHTLLEVKIGTGRTHQIRVHLSSLGHPVVGDRLYGAPSEPGLDRIFLHAWRIRFKSPAAGHPVTVEAALPPKLESFLHALRYN